MYPQELLQNFNVLNDPEETLRTQIESVVSSYNSPWDILTELIQNSIDAIHARRRLDQSYQAGRLRIIIDRTNSTVTVEDDGAGIPTGARTKLILPGGSFKKNNDTYGHKGLGFTYCAHVADRVEVQTSSFDGGTDAWTFENGFKWLSQPGNADPTLADGAETLAREFDASGTAVRLTLAVGRYEISRANTAILDSFFDWADDRSLLQFVLQTRTAIGQTFTLVDRKPPLPVTTKVFLVSSGTEFDVPYEYFNFFSYSPLSASTHPKAIDYANQVYLQPNQHNKTHHGIYHLFDHDPSANPTVLRVGTHKGGVKFSAYIHACGKENLADALGSYDQRLTTSHKHLAISTEVHLSINGMPCGVPMDRWDGFGGFEQRYFAMVDVDLSFGKVLDAGRKTVTRHYVDLFTKKIIELTKNSSLFGYSPNTISFHKLAQQLNSRAHGGGPTTVKDLIDEWKKKNPPLTTNQLLFDMIPSDEIGVYMLFCELVGRKHFKGWKALYASSAATYDMAMEFTYDFSDPSFGNQTVGGTAVLGPGANARTLFPENGIRWRDSSGARSFLVVECKVELAELLREIQGGRSLKNISHIDVVICLTADASAVSELGGALHPVTDPVRMFSGQTHILHYGAHQVHVLCLSSGIQYLTVSGQTV